MARFTFLGTGSIGNLERASISFALDLGDEGVLLIDTTSGRELFRQLAGAAIPLERIRYIYITHQHGDHSGGLGLILLRLLQMHAPDVTLWTPDAVTDEIYHSVDILYPGILDALDGCLKWRRARAGEPISIGSGLLMPFATEHSVPTLGCLISLADQTLAYAADTGPSKRVIEATRNADILIHEASGNEIESAGPQKAHAHGHSTAGDAARVAEAAGVKQLFLVHHQAETAHELAQLRTEAELYYNGTLIIPDDLYSFELAPALPDPLPI